MMSALTCREASPARRTLGPVASEAPLELTPGRFLGLLGLLLVAAFPGVILGRESFFLRDFGLFGYPLAHYHRECFWRGELPLWNPLNNCGLPFLAQWNTLVLYPGSLIYLLVPLPASLNWFCLAHQFLAGAGMYFLARRWTGHTLAAALAGVAYAFGGLTLNALLWPNNIAALGWMPWVILFAERACLEGGRTVLAAALVGALQMLAGAPEVILCTWVVAVAVCAGTVRRGDARGWTVVRRATGLVLLVAGLAAAQLLPFLDLLAHSQRGQGFASEDWSMPAWGWANLLVPLFHCNSTKAGVYYQPGQYWTLTYYVGVGTLALALCAVWGKPSRRVWILAGLALLGLVLALGERGGLYGWLKQVFPAAGLMRFPIKFVVLAVFALPLLAGFGLQKWCVSAGGARLRVGYPLSIVIPGLLGLLAGVVAWACWRPVEQGDGTVTLQNALAGGGFLLTTGGALVALRRSRSRRGNVLAVVGLLLIVWGDLLTHAGSLVRQMAGSSELHLAPAANGLARVEHGLFRVAVPPDAARSLNEGTAGNLAEDFLIHRHFLFQNCNLPAGIAKLDGFYSLYLPRERDVAHWLSARPADQWGSLAEFLGISHYVSSEQGLQWRSRANFLPLATAGQQPVFVAPEVALGGLVSTGFNPRLMVYLPSAAQDVLKARQATSAQILSSNYAPHRISFEVEAREPAWVVLAQSFYHCWRATVDGKPAPIWPANHAFQAVEVPPGRHRVELRYRDTAFLIGTRISGATLLGMAVAWFTRRRRASAPTPSFPAY